MMFSCRGAFRAATLWSTLAACSGLASWPFRASADEGAGGPGQALADPGGAAPHRTRAAHASAFENAARILASRKRDQPPLQISDVCARFSLDGGACERVARYLGRVSRYEERVRVHVKELLKVSTLNELRMGQPAPISLQNLCVGTMGGGYAAGIGSDLCKAVSYASGIKGASGAPLGERAIILLYGDGKAFYGSDICFPAIAKARPVDRADGNQVILDLNHGRHWGLVERVPSIDMPIAAKKGRLVWRGVNTGWCDPSRERTRMMMVSKFFRTSDPRIDVGFSEIVNGHEECRNASAYLKSRMTLEEQLGFRYILVVDGNDKASGLQWVLASNSVPFMVEPVQWESWLMESSLKPYVHYVPVRPDFSDLSSQIDWAAANAGRAKSIAEAGKRYVHQFSNQETQANIVGAVFTAYLDRVEVVGGAAAPDPLSQNCSS